MSKRRKATPGTRSARSTRTGRTSATARRKRRRTQRVRVQDTIFDRTRWPRPGEPLPRIVPETGPNRHGEEPLRGIPSE